MFQATPKTSKNLDNNYEQNNRPANQQMKSSPKRYIAAFIILDSYNVQLILLKIIYAKKYNLKYSHDHVATHYIFKPLKTDYQAGPSPVKVKLSGSYEKKHTACKIKTAKILRQTASNNAHSHNKIYKHQKEQQKIDKNSSISNTQIKRSRQNNAKHPSATT